MSKAEALKRPLLLLLLLLPVLPQPPSTRLSIKPAAMPAPTRAISHLPAN